MYRDAPRPVAKKRFLRTTQISRIVQLHQHRSVDLCVAVSHEKLPARIHDVETFASFEYVRQLLDISGGSSDVKHHKHKKPKEAERLIRKHGLSYRVTREQADFDEFFERMYEVQKSTKFGAVAFIKSREIVLDLFRRGFLILVLKDGKPIAGGVNCVVGDCMECRESGVLDADESYEKMGAQLALYYFGIQYARELGLRSVDLRSSRPFLNDGIFCHKHLWGATVCRNESLQYHTYFINTGSAPKLAQFYAHNPLIVSTAEGLQAILGSCEETEMSADDRSSLANRHITPGISGLIVMTPASRQPVTIALGAPAF
jgi:hypothetical protein